MIMEKTNITTSLENYLEAILFLKEKNGNVRLTDVATKMNISKPSVNKAITTLKSMGFVNQERYGLLNLSEKGERYARNIANRHYVLFDFLHNYLGVDIETAEKEACLIEHALSADTAQKLSEFLNNLKVND